MNPTLRPAKLIIKRGLQMLAANFGRHTRQAKQPELLILMYHRVLPANDPRAQHEEPGMMVTPETFKLHMEIVKQSFTVMQLSDWLALKESGGELPRRTCAITFDDGWLDNYEFAYPILQQLSLPATIFLVADMIGKSQMFWPERLAELLTNIAQQPAHWSHPSLDWIKQLPGNYHFTTSAPDSQQLSEIINACKSLSDEDIHQRLDLIEEKISLPEKQTAAALLNWQQVNEMRASGLIEAGSHTCRHIRLTADKNKTLLQQEIVNSKNTIENKTGQTIKIFCYPNGDYSKNAQSLVENNYIGAVTTERGWNSIHSNNHLLKRIGLHEDISNNKISFLARLSGWL